MPFQMALDEVLFRGLIEKQIEHAPILRFYFSSEPWVTVGYSHPQDQMDKERNQCRRITGGGRVEHGEDVIFSIIGQKEDDESFKSVRVSYWKIHEAVKMAYESLGSQPRFFRCDEKLPRGGDCFVYPIATDLALGDQKIAGGAQKRSSGIFLHQESLKVPAPMDAEMLVTALRQSFEKVFEIKLNSTICELEHLEQAKNLAREKYYPQEAAVTV